MKKDRIQNPSKLYNDLYHRMNNVFESLNPAKKNKAIQPAKPKKEAILSK